MSGQSLCHEEAAGGSERQQDRRTRQLTVKGLEEETFERAKEAARQSGLKTSAWIRVQVREAADRVLRNNGGQPDIDQDALLKITKLLQSINENQQTDRDEIQQLRCELTDVMKAQHGMMVKLIGK